MGRSPLEVHPPGRGTFCGTYLDGKHAWTRLSWSDSARRLVIEPDAATGALAPAPRTLTVELIPGGDRRTVRYEGRRVEVGF